jgi:hypothetical protein
MIKHRNACATGSAQAQTQFETQAYLNQSITQALSIDTDGHGSHVAGTLCARRDGVGFKNGLRAFTAQGQFELDDKSACKAFKDIV